jgi:dUTP pyrophosphatase
MSTVTVQVRPLPHFEGLELPAYETSGSAGMDVRAALPAGDPLTLKPGARAMVPTGLSVAIPEGYEIQVRPRSGLAAKHGLTCLNTPGTIDSDYRGEIKVILINLGAEAFVIQRGERIAHESRDVTAGQAAQESDEIRTFLRGEAQRPDVWV